MDRTIISLIGAEYRRYKGLGEGALEQLDDHELLVDAEAANSVATIVWHISGNLESRFTDFLDTDGEKDWRNRESEGCHPGRGPSQMGEGVGSGPRCPRPAL
jgi:hypothetical protein